MRLKRWIGTIIFIIYAIVAITVTVLLLSYNEYNCSELGDYTVYIVNDDSLEPRFKKGSILILKSTNDRNIFVGDELIFYKVYNSQEFEVVNRTLDSKSQQGRYITYTVTNPDAISTTAVTEYYSSEYLIGKADDAIVIEGWGTLLGILESKWGYLFCIVIVSLLLFLQEAFELFVEIKYGGDRNNKNAKNAKAVKSSGKTSSKTAGTTKTAGAAGTAKTTKTTGSKKTTGSGTAKPAAKKTVKPKPENAEKSTEEPADEAENEDTEAEEKEE